MSTPLNYRSDSQSNIASTSESSTRWAGAPVRMPPIKLIIKHNHRQNSNSGGTSSHPCGTGLSRLGVGSSREDEPMQHQDTIRVQHLETDISHNDAGSEQISLRFANVNIGSEPQILSVETPRIKLRIRSWAPNPRDEPVIPYGSTEITSGDPRPRGRSTYTSCNGRLSPGEAEVTISTPRVIDLLGSHIKFEQTLSKTYENAISRNLPSFQFFLGGSKTYKRTILSDFDILSSESLQQQHHLNTYVHLPYIYNLAGSKKHKSLAWQDNDLVNNMMSGIIKNIEYELGMMARLGTPMSQNGCVIHVGTWDDKAAGIRTIAESINRIKFPDRSTLLLENTAGSGTTIGKTLDELSQIYQLLSVESRDHVKICIDTQHIFASGQYDLRHHSEVDQLFSDFQTRFSIDRLGLIHFNDSKTLFNSHVDNHAILGQGEIWSQHHSSMNYILSRIERLGIPALIE
jgi:deoxyribonuclease-4